MLHALSFSGTTRVVNNGTDAVIVCFEADAAEMLVQAKMLGACGISTAVLAVNDGAAMDCAALDYFEAQNWLWVFYGKAADLPERNRISRGHVTLAVKPGQADELINEIRKLDRKRREGR